MHTIVKCKDYFNMMPKISLIRLGFFFIYPSSYIVIFLKKYINFLFCFVIENKNIFSLCSLLYKNGIYYTLTHAGLGYNRVDPFIKQLPLSFLRTFMERDTVSEMWGYIFETYTWKDILLWLRIGIIYFLKENLIKCVILNVTFCSYCPLEESSLFILLFIENLVSDCSLCPVTRM